MFPIEKNVPKTPANENRKAKGTIDKFQFLAMEVGDSFVVPNSGMAVMAQNVCLATRVMRLKASFRTQPDGTCRVWLDVKEKVEGYNIDWMLKKAKLMLEGNIKLK